MILMAV